MVKKRIFSAKSYIASLLVVAIVALLSGCGGGSSGGSATGWNDGSGTGNTTTTATVWDTSATSISDSIKDEGYVWTPGDTWVTQNLNQDEVSKLCGCNESKFKDHSGLKTWQHRGTKLPSSFSWKNSGGNDWTTTAKNQGAYGTCVAFATIGAFEALQKIADNRYDESVDYSEWYLWYKGTGNQNPSSGWYLSVAADALQNSGTVKEELCSYKPELWPKFTEPASGSYIYKANGKFTYVQGIDNMKEALLKGPLVGSMTVWYDFSFYTGDQVYHHVSKWKDKNSNWVNNYQRGGHAILIVGWDDDATVASTGEKGCWICKNSWSENWGDKGFFKIAYDEVNSAGYLMSATPSNSQQPAITSISPSPVYPGQQVTITGSGFGNDTQYPAGLLITSTWPVKAASNAKKSNVQSISSAKYGNSLITYNKYASSCTTWTDSKITFTFNSDAPSGPYKVVVSPAASGVSSSPFMITVDSLNKPTITSINPTTVSSGSSITITGSNFGSTRGSSTVNFTAEGGTSFPASSYGPWSSTQISCVPPAKSGKYAVSVTLQTASDTITSDTMYITVGDQPANGPVITSISPSSVQAGNSFTISGTNFGTAIGSVTIGTAAATVTAWSDTSITAAIPASTAAGTFTLTVTPNGSSASATFAITVTSGGPVVTSCNSTVYTGQTFTVNGSGFGSSRDSGQSSVSFVPQITGGTALTPSNYISWSDTVITCTAPTVTVGVQYMIVVNRYTSSGMLSSSTVAGSANTTVAVSQPTYVTITSITPNPVSLGSLITIAGSNFGTAAGTVSIGGVNATLISWSDTSITARVPASIAAGTYTLTVTPSGSSTYATFALTVAAGPVITSISPATAFPGTSVTITGLRFGTVTGTVTIGGTQASVVTWSDSSITVTVPASQAAGAFTLTVTPNGSTAYASTSITIVAGPAVTSCTASLTPGQTCTIIGSGFGSSRDSGQSSVSFVPQLAGGTILTSGTYLTWSDTGITLVTPSLVTGVQYVIVVNRYTSSGTISSSTTAASANTTVGTAPTTAPVITSQSPATAVPGESVTLTGTNLPTTNGYVLVNGLVVSATLTTTTATFTVPAGLTTSAAVTVGGGTGGSVTWAMLIQ